MNWLEKWFGRSDRRTPSLWEEWMAETCSGSGYVRERAVRALAASNHGPALPLLLARANDWVPEVRAAAAEALTQFLRDEHIGAWALALKDLAALHRARRADHASLLRDIEAFLAKPANLAQLQIAPAAASREVIRLLFRIEFDAASNDDPVRELMLRRTLSSNEVAMAAQAAAAIDSLPTAEQRFALARIACASKFAQVRAAGLRAALQICDASSQGLAEQLSRDPSASVRAIALPALDTRRDSVAAEALRTYEGSASARRRSIALDIFSALEPDRAEALCKSASVDNAASVRQVAFARRFSWARGDAKDALVVEALADASPSIRKLAVLQVTRGAAVPTTDQLLAVLEAQPQTLFHLLRVTQHASPWAELIFLLRALDAPDVETRCDAALHEMLSRWSPHTRQALIRPTPSQLDITRRIWHAVRSKAAREVQKRIDELLQDPDLVG